MNNPNVEIASKKVEKIKLDFKDSKYATGRRKKSIARVWVKKGSGKIYVNGKQMQDYFKRPVHQILVVRPLNEINASAEYDVKCNVTGGGLSGQAGAIIHGLSRALVSIAIVAISIGLISKKVINYPAGSCESGTQELTFNI